MKPFGIIYLATNLINWKQYIGQTTGTLETRMKQHFSSAKNGRQKTNYFLNSIRKHGPENFEFIELETCKSLSELNFREEMTIIKYDSLSSGYNSNFGGDNFDRTQKSIEKVSGNWLIIDENENWIIITNLSQYCKNNNLCQSTMNEVSTGLRESCAGFKCYKIVNGSPVMPDFDNFFSY